LLARAILGTFASRVAARCRAEKEHDMANVDVYAPGAFCWAELATSDGEGAKQFYTSLLGWKSNDIPMGEMGTYHMMQLEGRDVGAMFQMGPDMKGIPPHWITYVSVADVDAAVKRAESLGAKTLVPAMDVFDYGRTAQLADPTGASFALWQPKKHIGAGVRGGRGTTCWNELVTSDIARAKAFYGELFGWKLKESPEYNEITNGDAPYPQGGLMQLRPEMGPMPSHWSVYFQVDSVDGEVERAKGLGATLLAGPMDIPNAGRFAVMKDPQGAAFQFFEGQS
jgi:uncharacterized protein